MKKKICGFCLKEITLCSCPYIYDEENPFLNAPYASSPDPSPGEIFARTNDGRTCHDLLTRREEWDEIKKAHKK